MISKHAVVIAPAGPLEEDKITAGTTWLKNNGMTVTVMPHVSAGATEKYFAATPDARANDLHAAWRNPEIDLIICTRGGFGCSQILPLIDWELLRSRNIPLLGLSDITALHLAMLKNGIGTPISGPMLGRLPEMDEFTAEALKRAFIKAAPTELAAQSLQKGDDFEAFPRALNLTVAASLCGTPFMPNLSGSLLILEDIAEPPYKIERALTQLKQCGILNQCAGLVFGQFTDCGEPAQLEHIFRKYAAELKVPAWHGFPFGHEPRTVTLNWNHKLQIRGMRIYS